MNRLRQQSPKAPTEEDINVKSRSTYSIGKAKREQSTGGFLPKIIMKSANQITGTRHEVFRSLDESSQLRTRIRKFDFSNLNSTNAIAYFQQERQQSATIKKGRISSIQSELIKTQYFTKLSQRRIISQIIKTMQNDLELQIVIKQLFLNTSKILQFLTMIAPPIQSYTNNFSIKIDSSFQFFTIHRKLASETNQQLYLIELDRLFYCISFIGIPIQLPPLVHFAELSYSLFADSEFGMIIRYSTLFAFAKMVLQHIKQQSQQDMSTTTAGTDQEDDGFRNPLGNQILQKLMKNQQKKKVHFKLKRLGYLNEENITEFYDSYADLIKIVGSEMNARNYSFHCIRYGFMKLTRHPIDDPDVMKELKVFGIKSRGKLPIFMQVLYQHKIHPEQIVELTKIYLYLTKEQPLIIAHRDFQQPTKLLQSSWEENAWMVRYFSTLKTTGTAQFLNDTSRTLKNEFVEQVELYGVYYEKIFEESEPFLYDAKVPDIRKDNTIRMAQEVSSQSENEEDIYSPIFVKRIQSYPLLLKETQADVESVFNYRYSYWKMFNSTTLKQEEMEISNQKIKPAFQFKEKFLVIPSCDDGRYQRHIEVQPTLQELSDQSDYELVEQPLDALDQLSESDKKEFQYVPSLNQCEKKIQCFKSDSSTIHDEFKGVSNQKLHHSVENYMLIAQDNFKSIACNYDPIHIPFAFQKSEVSRIIMLKNLEFDGDTPIIESSLSMDNYIRLFDQMKMEEIESEEEPDFDELPIETDVPQQAFTLPQNLQDDIISEQSEQNIGNGDLNQINDKFIEVSDLNFDGKTILIEVKDQYVSKIEIKENEEINFFLGDRLRKSEPVKYEILMEGKTIKSVQVNVQQQGNKIFLRSFCLLAVVDQRIEEQQKKIKKEFVKKQQFEEDQDQDEGFQKQFSHQTMISEIQEFLSLPSEWNLGQFLIHVFYPSNLDCNEQLIIQLNWLKKILETFFPEIIILENEIEIIDQNLFEAYIYGVGPLAKRDGNQRILLFKKDQESWQKFISLSKKE